MLDTETLRKDTPAAGAYVHLNNASSSLMPTPVVAAMHRWLQLEAELGHHGAVEAHQDEVDEVDRQIAALLGCDQPVEYFDTVARTFVLLLNAIEWRRGDRILLQRHEWGGVAAAARRLADNCGVQVEEVPTATDMSVDTTALADRIDDRVRAICLPMQPAAGGRATLRLDVARPDGCLVFADAAQALGQMPFRMHESDFDVVVGTARKWLRGPRGIAFAGFSAAGAAMLDRARWLGTRGGAPVAVSDFTRVLRMGLGAAAGYALELGLDDIRSRILDLARHIHRGLAQIDGITPLERDAPSSGIVAATAAGGREAELVETLGAAGVRVAVLAAHYHPGLFEDRGMERVLRLSAHVFNTETEVNRALDVLAAAMRG